MEFGDIDEEDDFELPDEEEDLEDFDLDFGE